MFDLLLKNLRSNSTLLRKMEQNLLAAVTLTIGVLAIGGVGCVSGIGPGCHTGGCYDCDGMAGRPIPHGPLDGLRQFKRQLTCGGGGCGEVYAGEWISTPPDAFDPCCGDQFVGGATPCRPFCWQPGSLLTSLRLSGRFSDGMAHDDCGCHGDHGGFHEGMQDQYFSEGTIGRPVYHEHTNVYAGQPGCSTCANSAIGGGPMAGTPRLDGRASQPRRVAAHAPPSTHRSVTSGTFNGKPNAKPLPPRSSGGTVVR